MEIEKMALKEELFLVVREAQNNPVQQVETMATALAKSEHISPLDACKCTGNCPEIC